MSGLALAREVGRGMRGSGRARSLALRAAPTFAFKVARSRGSVLVAALTIAAVAAGAVPAEAQQSAAIRVIRDCGDNGRLDRTYSRADLRSALRALPSDQEEYSYCRDAILAAQTAVKRPESGSGSGGPGSSGGGSSGGGAGSSGSSGTGSGDAGSLPDSGSAAGGQPDLGTGSGGSGTGAGPEPTLPTPSAPAVPTGPSPEDLAELERAAGATTPPAALARAGSRDLPTALLLALICLGVAAVLAIAPLIRHLRPPAGRGPLALRRR